MPRLALPTAVRAKPARGWRLRVAALAGPAVGSAAARARRRPEGRRPRRIRRRGPVTSGDQPAPQGRAYSAEKPLRRVSHGDPPGAGVGRRARDSRGVSGARARGRGAGGIACLGEASTASSAPRRGGEVLNQGDRSELLSGAHCRDAHDPGDRKIGIAGGPSWRGRPGRPPPGVEIAPASGLAPKATANVGRWRCPRGSQWFRRSTHCVHEHSPQVAVAASPPMLVESYGGTGRLPDEASVANGAATESPPTRSHDGHLSTRRARQVDYFQYGTSQADGTQERPVQPAAPEPQAIKLAGGVGPVPKQPMTTTGVGVNGTGRRSVGRSFKPQAAMGRRVADAQPRCVRSPQTVNAP